MANSGQYKIPNYAGGINKGIDSSLINANQAADAQNCNIDRDVLSTCSGFNNYLTPGFSQVPKSMFVYYKNNTPYLIVAVGGKLYKFTNGVAAEIGTGFQSDYWDAVNYNYNSQDVIIMCNGVDNTKIYDGTTLRDLMFDSTQPPGGTNLAPKGKYIALHFERIWIANDTTVYASNDLNVEDWTTPDDEVEQNQHGVEISIYSNVGAKIKGMTVIFNDIILWLEKGMVKIFGSDPTNYQKLDFSPKGGISDKSIANFEKGSFFIDKGGIFLYDGVNVSPISQALGILFSDLNQSLLEKAVGYVWKSKYILSVPEGVNTDNNLVIEYDYDNKNFMFKRGFSIQTMTDMSDKLLFCGGDGNIHEYGIGNTFNGQPISTFWETGYSDMGLPESTKEMEMLYFTAYGSGDVKIIITTELGSKTIQKTLSGIEKVYPVIFSHRGRLLKIRIENVNGSTFTLKGFKIIIDHDVD